MEVPFFFETADRAVLNIRYGEPYRFDEIRERSIYIGSSTKCPTCLNPNAPHATTVIPEKMHAVFKATDKRSLAIQIAAFRYPKERMNALPEDLRQICAQSFPLRGRITVIVEMITAKCVTALWVLTLPELNFGHGDFPYPLPPAKDLAQIEDDLHELYATACRACRTVDTNWRRKDDAARAATACNAAMPEMFKRLGQRSAFS